MKNISYLLVIIFFFSNCKKDNEIYTTRNAIITVPAAVDTSFTLTVYPNPCDSFMNLQLKFQRASPLLISVYDITGRLIYQPNVTFQMAGGQSTIGINTGNFLNGLYFVICEYDKGKLTHKIIVQH